MWVSSTMPKFRKKTMMQFQENTWTEGWMGVQYVEYANKIYNKVKYKKILDIGICVLVERQVRKT